VLLSVIDEWPIIRASLSAGVRGYVVKDDAADELVTAIDAVVEGGWYVSASGRHALWP